VVTNAIATGPQPAEERDSVASSIGQQYNAFRVEQVRQLARQEIASSTSRSASAVWSEPERIAAIVEHTTSRGRLC
jgi:hypothetical protein